ncbi:MAG: helix-turn-helix transcriptional regulator [Cyanobacteria bacterium J06621_11]
MSARSLRVKPDCVEQVNQIFERNGHCTQEDFGEAINLHPDTIRNFLKGKPVLRRTFYEICEVLEIDPLDIIFDASVTEDGLAPIEDSIDQIEHSSIDEDQEINISKDENEQIEGATKEGTKRKPKDGIWIRQAITHNSGLVIGNVQGDVNP